MNWYQFTKIQLETELKTNLTTGLSQAEAKARLSLQGPNLLPEKPPESWWLVFFRQFQSPFIYILFVCSAVIYFLNQITDASIILVVLLINAVIGMLQEGRAGRILQSLKKLSFSEATVLREGVEVILPEAEVVLGDILVLKEGQKVTADARVIFSHNLGLDEAALTGESGAVPKKDAVLGEENLPVSAQHNLVFKGTAVLSGDGQAVVVGVAQNTEIGKISKMLQRTETEMPLQKNLKRLSKAIIYFVLASSVFLFFLGIQTGRSGNEMFSLVVSLAVSVIPEGLPLVLTVILAHGVWRMSKKQALVRKLGAVEALGEAKILAVDKTGTLTENQMVVRRVYTGQKIFHISGEGYKPQGSALFGDLPVADNIDIQMAAKIAVLVSKATVQLDEQSGVYKVSGDPTEAAMAVLGEKLGINKEREQQQFVELAEIPFEYKNKYRAVFYENKERVFCAAAGAPEVILASATHYLENGQARELLDREKKLFEEAQEEFSQMGLRVVGFGYKFLTKTHPFDNIHNLVFGGFFAIEDALRPEAKQAVAFAQSSGVKVVMITGDLRSTAKAIATEAGIFKEGDTILTGTELQSLSKEQLAGKLDKVSVFARVVPEDKMKIIEAYRHIGLVVAMTGDGVNDAPSLMAADLGVAMGKIGTEVAKEASDIVLLNDNLHGIVTAIKEGRVMHSNIRKALQFLFSTSLGEMLTIVFTLFLRLPLPVTAVQILWLNLITDPLSGAALALEKEEDGEVNKKSHFSKYFLDVSSLSHILLIGLVMSSAAIYVFNSYYLGEMAKAQTIALSLLAVFQWYNSLNCRFNKASIFTTKIFSNSYIWMAFGLNLILQLFAVYNPFMQKVLKTTALNLNDWLVVFALGLLVILADEIRKWILRRRSV